MTYLFFISLLALLLFLAKMPKRPALGLAFLVFLLPFERIPSYDLLFFGGITVRLSQVVGGFLILLLFFKILTKKRRIKVHFAFWLLALYLLVALASISVAGNKERAFLVWLFHLFVILLAFTIFNFLEKKENLKLIEKYLYWATLIATLFGLLQFLGSSLGLPDHWLGLRIEYGDWSKAILGFPRVQSFALEPLYFANFLLIPFGLFLMLAFKEPTPQKYLLILSLITLNVVLTCSRGIYLSWLAVLLVAPFVLKNYLFSKKSLLIFSLIGMSILLGVGMLVLSSLYINKGTSKLGNLGGRVTTVKGSQAIAVGEREIAIQHAWQAFQSSPLLGVGIGNFGPWESGYPKEVPKGGWNIVNNEPLEILAETGLLGFLSLALALSYIFIKGIEASLKTQNNYLKGWINGLLLALFGIAIQYQTFSTLYIMHIWVALGLLLACVNLIKKQNAIQKSDS